MQSGLEVGSLNCLTQRIHKKNYSSNKQAHCCQSYYMTCGSSQCHLQIASCVCMYVAFLLFCLVLRCSCIPGSINIHTLLGFSWITVIGLVAFAVGK